MSQKQNTEILTYLQDQDLNHAILLTWLQFPSHPRPPNPETYEQHFYLLVTHTSSTSLQALEMFSSATKEEMLPEVRSSNAVQGMSIQDPTKRNQVQLSSESQAISCLPLPRLGHHHTHLAHGEEAE